MSEKNPYIKEFRFPSGQTKRNQQHYDWQEGHDSRDAEVARLTVALEVEQQTTLRLDTELTELQRQLVEAREERDKIAHRLVGEVGQLRAENKRLTARKGQP